MPAFERALGSPMQTVKFWLDIDYPDGPPPEYVRSGSVQVAIISVRLLTLFTV